MESTIDSLRLSASSLLKEAMRCIEENAQGICFVVNEENVLLGVITDGDIRRALLNGASLQDNVEKYISRNCIRFPVGTSQEEISRKLSSTIRHIPLVDDQGRLVDYASLTRFHRIPVMTPSLNGNEMNYVVDCIRTGWISSQGAYVSRFENEFAAYVGANHAVAVSNGTVAIHLALVAMGIGPGDEVIVPDLTFAASINAILYTGAIPVLADVNEKTFCLDVDQLESLITARTKAIMPVHLYGHPCQMDVIVQLAAKYHLQIVEDCAEAIGSHFQGKHVGTFGESATFSFFGNKTITTGEGGMVLFRSQEMADKARMLRDHGMNKQKRYWHDEIGFNYRMTNLQAAIGCAQMERIEEFVSAKKKLANIYNEILGQSNLIQVPAESPGCISGYWLYTIVLKNMDVLQRDIAIQRLLKNGIESRPVFYPLHRMPPYQKYAAGKSFAVSDKLSDAGISLPSSVSLERKELELIAKSVFDITNNLSEK